MEVDFEDGHVILIFNNNGMKLQKFVWNGCNIPLTELKHHVDGHAKQAVSL